MAQPGQKLAQIFEAVNRRRDVFTIADGSVDLRQFSVCHSEGGIEFTQSAIVRSCVRHGLQLIRGTAQSRKYP